MNIPGIPTSKPAGSGLRWLVAITCLAVLAAVGAYFWDRHKASATDQATVAHVHDLTQQIDAAEQAEQQLRRAILGKRAILGMNRAEVRMAKGEPRTILGEEALPEVALKAGGSVAWVYRDERNDTASVIFNRLGLVIYSKDVAETGEPAIRKLE